LYNNLTA